MKDDGGQAFPEIVSGEANIRAYVDGYDLTFTSAGGMSLRDYFAAKAMQSIMNIEIEDAKNVLPDDTAASWIARHAYFMADAMLRERSK